MLIQQGGISWGRKRPTPAAADSPLAGRNLPVAGSGIDPAAPPSRRRPVIDHQSDVGQQGQGQTDDPEHKAGDRHGGEDGNFCVLGTQLAGYANRLRGRK